MSEAQKNVLTGFTRELFPQGAHVCLIFDSDEQRQQIVSEYMAGGLRQGEFVRYFTDVTTPATIRSWLVEMGVEFPEAQDNEAFRVSEAERAYCPSGRFEPQKMIDGMLPRYDQLKKAGYSGIRSCGEMTWTLKGLPGSDRLLEYEALLSTVAGTFPHSGMCLYDARRFDGATLFNVLKVHPYMIVQGQIVRNPYYIRPEEFLAKLRAGQ